MLTLYFGGIEVSDALTIDRKVTHVTSSLADLVTQAKSITNSDMANILDASASVMAPYAVGSLQITVTEISIDPRARRPWRGATRRNGRR